MATALMLGGLALSLLVIWGTGYALVLALAPTVFRPRAVEASVALLIGVCAGGVALLIPAYIVSGERSVELATRWTLPAVFALALGGVLLRRRRASNPSLVAALAVIEPRSLLRAAPAWLSALALLLAAGVVVALRPTPTPTVELYGARAAYGYQVSVATTSPAPERFVVVARYMGRADPVAVPVSALSATTGPATVTLPEGSGLRVELYRAGEEMRGLPALGKLSFDLR